MLMRCGEGDARAQWLRKRLDAKDTTRGKVNACGRNSGEVLAAEVAGGSGRMFITDVSATVLRLYGLSFVSQHYQNMVDVIMGRIRLEEKSEIDGAAGSYVLFGSEHYEAGTSSNHYFEMSSPILTLLGSFDKLAASASGSWFSSTDPAGGYVGLLLPHSCSCRSYRLLDLSTRAAPVSSTMIDSVEPACRRLPMIVLAFLCELLDCSASLLHRRRFSWLLRQSCPRFSSLFPSGEINDLGLLLLRSIFPIDPVILAAALGDPIAARLLTMKIFFS
ncbi:hypothetical protein KSP39_PZI016564 [Platanthera zijinensis]|uniref:Uncharacterized protein n=1 Tax=Platanthera zijinensis TaxID=2320716 RepID=A0AAP0B7C5_9ASPA